MTRRVLVGGLTAISLAVALTGANPANAQQYYGGGWGGPGMMGPGMMGPGMMGPGYGGGGCGGGPGMMGPGYGGYRGGYSPGWMGPGMMGGGYLGYGAPPANLNLSVNDVRNDLQQWIARSGNSHLKVGSVTETDPNTVTAEIVTIDKDALVQRYTVNRQTGFFSPTP